MRLRHEREYDVSPADIHGTITLPAEGGATREVVELDVHVEIPVVGGELESIPSERIRTSLEGEHRAGVRRLEGDPA